MFRGRPEVGGDEMKEKKKKRKEKIICKIVTHVKNMMVETRDKTIKSKEPSP